MHSSIPVIMSVFVGGCKFSFGISIGNFLIEYYYATSRDSRFGECGEKYAV